MEPTTENAALDSVWADAGVDSYIEALESVDAITIMDIETQEQIMHDIAESPTWHQAEVAEAFLEAIRAATAGLGQLIVDLSKATDSGASAQEITGEAMRILLPMTHAIKENHQMQEQENLGLIESCWSPHIASPFRSVHTMSSSLSRSNAAMSSNVDHSIAVAYMNAEILTRMESDLEGSNSTDPTRHGVSDVDAQRAMEKVVADLEDLSYPMDALRLPTLDRSLSKEHRLRIDKTSGLLDQKPADESGDENDERQHEGKQVNAEPDNGRQAQTITGRERVETPQFLDRLES